MEVQGHLPTQRDVETCLDDGELLLALRGWTGGFRFQIGPDTLGLTVVDGEPLAQIPHHGQIIELQGPIDVWSSMCAAVPRPLSNTVATMVRRGLTVTSDPLVWWQYLAATERFIELLRAPNDERAMSLDEGRMPGTLAAATGRYVHLKLGEHVHRVYFEEAGQGRPVLLQHTAGSHGVQWRHLLDDERLTSRYRLIAYDLPFHGKSLPPVSAQWWAQQYRLTGSFLRAVPVALAQALSLEQPIFMGCSVGGLLALDLALNEPDTFRAVISVEGALRIGGDLGAMVGFDHPSVSSTAKARMMEGLCSPTSPLPYVKEVSFAYSAGWPQAFLGDLAYYVDEYDLRNDAARIDTTRCGVHILNGEYDYSGTVERGLDAHRAIAGSTHTTMRGVGHFPMAENPTQFIDTLLPILDSIEEPVGCADRSAESC